MEQNLLRMINGKRKARAPPWRACLLLLVLLLEPTQAVVPWAQGAGCAAHCTECFGAAANQCLTCASGYVRLNLACVASSGSACGTGYRVEGGICVSTAITSPDICPHGTYGATTGQTTSCVPCGPKVYCPARGASSSTGDCAAGFYCTASSAFQKPLAALGAGSTPMVPYFVTGSGDYCGPGTTCPAGSRATTACTGGVYCPLAMSAAIDTARKCQAGYYCSKGATTASPTDGTTGALCPEGHYCLEGSSQGTACPVGTFLSAKGATAESQCMPCTPGTYCGAPGLAAPMGPCAAGYYCPSPLPTTTANTHLTAAGNPKGQSVATPIATQCPSGYFCTAGSISAQMCPPGEFTTGARQSSCASCPAQYYCGELGSQTLCAAGYYCPGADAKVACPLGTLSALTGRSAAADCSPCPAGFACATVATTLAQVPCRAGFVCTGGAASTRPGTTAQGGGMCAPGEYCRTGATTRAPCGPGQYCKDYAAGTPGARCEAGYYCPGSATKSNWLRCTAGHYCRAGAHAQEPCPVGTYSESEGASSSATCEPCPPGYGCLVPGLASPYAATAAQADQCPAGYYCTSGTGTLDTAQAGTSSAVSGSLALHVCPAGYECPAGSLVKKACQPGTYQAQTQSSSCTPCPAGSYCDGAWNSVDNGKKTCPAGFYCPVGTTHAQEYPCPAGTFNSQLGQTSVAGCTPCPATHYCQHRGATAATTLILAGYYGLAPGQTRPDPNRCPAFAYCPVGSATPAACPDGSWTPWVGALAVSDCIPCARGRFCRYASMYAAETTTFTTAAAYADPAGALGTTGYALYSGPCAPGYVCLAGASSATPTDATGYRCPKGHFCDSTYPGASTGGAVPCLHGTWAPAEGAGACASCPAGTYCSIRGASTTELCPPGSYCSAGSTAPTPCPAGTFRATAGGSSLSSCTGCTAGMYCALPGSSIVTGPCKSGFVCGGSSPTATPWAAVWGASAGSVINGRCPPGSYCPPGSGVPRSCPTGSYSPSDGASECLACSPGAYCGLRGLTAPDGSCAVGHYCNFGAVTGTPVDGVTGAACPAGHYCLAGSAAPLACPDGTRSTLTGQSSCPACAAGKSCRAGVEVTCDNYRYCAASAGPARPYGSLCPAGTYLPADARGTKAAADCGTCPAGKYCVAGRVAGACAAGYICQSGAASPTPSGTAASGAYPCPFGYFCPPGAVVEQECASGLYTYSTGARQKAECSTCQGGYYCESGEEEPELCPYGHYCPPGSESPIPCPFFRYNPTQGAVHRDHCKPCKRGYYCDTKGLGNLYYYGSKYKCPSGHFCPAGTRSPFACMAGTYAVRRRADPAATIDQCTGCPQHRYCPLASKSPLPCPSGTYCPTRRGWPLLCPAGSYCQSDGTTVSVRACPVGYHCPVGTAQPIRCDASRGQVCPAGSVTPLYSSITAASCQPGTFFGYGRCNPCVAGFVCQGRTTQRFPLFPSTERGYECPPGHYCPAASSLPLQCPVGRFRLASKGKSLAEDCELCPAGTFNTKTGQASCTVCGRGATSSPDRTSCSCRGAFRAWRESTRSCVCQSGYVQPNITQASQTSTENNDCVPLLDPKCPTGSHRDDQTNECVSNAVCAAASRCGGTGATNGYFDSKLNKCFCSNTASDARQYCDASCQAKALQAYITSEDKVFLKPGDAPESAGATYEKSQFPTLLLDGLKCAPSLSVGSTSTRLCLIQNVDTRDGAMGGKYEAPEPFVKKWQQTHPGYVSPYATRRQLTGSSGTSSDSQGERDLQGAANGAAAMPSAIMVVSLGDAVSFETSAEHFPVYLRNSGFNTNPVFDDGVFDTLKTKIISSGLDITSFAFTFSKEGVYVFGDYANPADAQTIVVVSAELKPTIVPLTAANLQKLGVVQAAPELQVLPFELAAIAPAFLAASLAALLLQNILELRIQKRETKKTRRSVTLQKNYDRMTKKESILAYIDDLQVLVRQNLDEVKAKIAQGGDRKQLHQLIESKLSIVNELKDTSKDDLASIIELTNYLLENLRFADGRALKECLEELRLKRRLKEAEDGADATPSDSEEVEEDTAGSGSQDSEIHAASQQDSPREDSSSELTDEAEAEERERERQPNEEALEMLVNAEANVNARKDQFAENLAGVDEAEREQLLKGLDDKMGALNKEMALAQQQQEERLKAQQAARERRRRANQEKLVERTEAVDEEIRQLDGALGAAAEQRDELLETGIVTEENQRELATEKKAEAQRLQAKKEEKVKEIRDEYMSRLKGAKTAAEKERMLTEMQSRIKAAEAEQDKERKAQLKLLEKSLRSRQKKRLQRQLEEQEGEMEKLQATRVAKEEEKDVETLRLYVEGGDLVPDILQETAAHLVDKVTVNELKFELDKSDKDQLDIIQVRHQTEMEKAMKAASAEVEQDVEDERQKLADQAKAKREAQRQALVAKLGSTPSEKERKLLLDQLKNFDENQGQHLMDEKLKQDRLLEERRKARQQKKQIRALEVKLRQQNEMNEKEVAINDQKLQAELGGIDERLTRALEAQVRQISSRPAGGHKEQALVIVNEAMDEASKKKLTLLLQKQFFELQKYLANLHAGVTLERVIDLEKAKARLQDLEDDAHAELAGDALADRLDELQRGKHLELEKIKRAAEVKAREAEVKLREAEEEKFFKEKEALVLKDHQRKRTMLEQVVEGHPDEPLVQELGKKLLGRLGKGAQEQLMDLEKERDEQIEAAQCKLIADSEAEVREVQRIVDAQVHEEEQKVEEAMQARMQQLREQRRQQLEERKKELLKQQESLTGFQISKLKDQYERELNDLEAAIRREEAQQLSKMRKALLARKIAKEAKKKREKAKAAELEQERLSKTPSPSQAVRPAGQTTSVQMQSQSVVASGQTSSAVIVTGGRTIEAEAAGDDLLRILLGKWAEKVKSAKDADFENVWEKRTARAGQIEIAVDPGEDAATTGSAQTGVSEAAETGVIGQDRKQAIEFTVEELFRRMRRIEKLTRMIRQEDDQEDAPVPPSGSTH